MAALVPALQSCPIRELRPKYRALPKTLPTRCLLPLLLACWGIAFHGLAQAQWSEDPSDATPSLIAAVNNPLTPAESTACTNASSNGPFSMGSASTVTANTPALPFAPCAYTATPYPPSAPKDIWFRLDPAFADAVYRFTLLPGSAPAMTKGGIALYEAPSAAGPFRLLSCAAGGGMTATMASAEATGLTGGKIYVRVWDYTPTANSNFTICVMGQRVSTMPDRGADETPCTARTLTAVGAFNTAGTSPPLINFVYAHDEAGFLPSNGEKAGGDLWVKLLVPPTGHVIIKASFGTAPANQIGSGSPVVGSMGVSAYLASDCSDHDTFKEVGSAATLVTPAGATAASANLNIRCLPGGAWLYVRLYALKESASGTKVKRFGQMRFEWMNGPLPYPGWTPADRPANCDPCGAVDLVMDAPCDGTPVPGGNTIGACAAAGIPDPACGGYGSSTPSVWHKFTAPPSGVVQIDAAGAGPAPINPAMALYTSNDQGCGGRMALVACDDRQGPGNNARIIKWGLVPGQTYYIRTWSTTTDGTFSLCVKEVRPSSGNCLYMIDLWTEKTTGNPMPSITMTVSIDGGTPVPYTGDPSGSFLVEIPAGSSADFHISGTGTTGMYFFALWQAGWLEPTWWGDGGYGVYGPQPAPVLDYHLPEACAPQTNKSPRDCAGMKTICLNPASSPPLYTFSGSIRNGSPLNSHNMEGVGSQPYEGYTYSEGNGYAYDLAGANMGCLDPEGSGINWLVFRPTANGTVGLMFQAIQASVAEDMDFAIWDLGPLVYDPGQDSIHVDAVCPPQTPPIRCSSARVKGYTGLLEGRTETMDGHGGYGFLEPLPVQVGHGYLIALTPVNLTGNVSYYVSWSMYKDALGTSDPGIVSCANLVLPVELLFLAGVPDGNKVQLSWATASEKNSSHFIVERSADAQDFTPIGRVNASGNTQYRTDYALTDAEPLDGLNYYRLRQVDLDGSTDLSNVIVVAFTGDGKQAAIYPNPVTDLLNMRVNLAEAATLVVRVLDATGRVVHESAPRMDGGPQHVSIHAADLAPGVYLVQVADVEGNPIATARFVKE